MIILKNSRFLFFFLLTIGSIKGRSQQPILTLNTEMHTAMINRIDLDALGRYLLTASDDKTAKLWDLHNKTLVRTFRIPFGAGNEGKLFACALSPDGQTAAVGGWSENNDIYVFEVRSGQLKQRISGLSNLIHDLAYSSNGKYLAAALGGSRGIRIYSSQNGKEVARDSNYGASSYGLTWDKQGHLASTCYDGYVRLYTTSFQLQIKRKPIGGSRPFSLAFSPDSKKLAVGFEDSPRLQVLDGTNLGLLYEPDISEFKEDDFISSITFTPDGRYLVAGGSYYKYQGQKRWMQVRIWLEEGRGRYQDIAAGSNTIMDLHSRHDGELVFASSQPDFGNIHPDLRQRLYYQSSPLHDYSANDKSHFRLGANGLEVGITPFGGEALSFFVRNRRLQAKTTSHPASREVAGAIHISNWKNTYTPQLNGQPIVILKTYESCRSVDVDNEVAILGTDWNLYCLDQQGRQRWKQSIPSIAWAVKIDTKNPVIAAALGDGTIRWYRLRDGQPLLSLFLHPDGRWLLWTPSGFYDASPGAENFIGWHLNQGPAKEALYYPVSKFRQRFYRPKVIDLILETLDENEALRKSESASSDLVKSDQTRNLLDKLPPEVVIHNPENGTLIRNRQIELIYSLRSPNGEDITGLRIQVDGRPLSTQRGFIKPSGSRLRSTVQIPEKDCVVSLIAENRFGSSEATTIRLKWVGSTPKLVDMRPNLYVLAVGVSDYTYLDQDLDFAAKDARDFVQAVQKFEGGLYKQVEVKLLTDGQATKDDILDGLDWLQRQPTSRDVAMLFFAGHGVDDNASNFFYLPVNADMNSLRRTGISKEEVQITIRSVSGKILVFMDACHSGGLGLTPGLSRRSIGPDINIVINDLISAENGAVVFTSSTSRQYSLEDSRWNNGAFTKALVEGLGGRACTPGTSKVTIKSLDAYIAERVKVLTNGQQAPTTAYPPNVPDFPIGVVEP